MNFIDRLEHLRTKELCRIKNAAERGDSTSIPTSARLIEEVELLMRKYSDFTLALQDLEQRVKVSQRPLKTDNLSSGDTLVRLSARSIGREIARKRRVNFIKKAFSHGGIKLSHYKNRIYTTPNGGMVGITYASEKQSNRWFHDLPRKDYLAIAFLCNNSNDKELDFILPKEFLEKLKNQFGRSGDLYKFNIVLQSNQYLLQIPHSVNEIRIDHFIDAFSSLRD